MCACALSFREMEILCDVTLPNLGTCVQCLENLTDVPNGVDVAELVNSFTGYTRRLGYLEETGNVDIPISVLWEWFGIVAQEIGRETLQTTSDNIDLFYVLGNSMQNATSTSFLGTGLVRQEGWVSKNKKDILVKSAMKLMTESQHKMATLVTEALGNTAEATSKYPIIFSIAESFIVDLAIKTGSLEIPREMLREVFLSPEGILKVSQSLEKLSESSPILGRRSRLDPSFARFINVPETAIKFVVGQNNIPVA